MNYKKILLILIIAATMYSCSDNTNTEPEQKIECETHPLDTTFIGNTMKIMYKDCVTLDWSLFDSVWAVSDSLRNTEFTILGRNYYDDEINISYRYLDTFPVIKNDSAKIKEIFNDFWEKHKKYAYLGYIKNSDNLWEYDWRIGGYFDIYLNDDLGNQHYTWLIGVASGYPDEFDRKILDRKVQIQIRRWK
jgi:hypothetical protein